MPNPRLEVLIKKCFFSHYTFSTLLHAQDLLTVTLPSLPFTSSQTTRQTSSFNRDMSAWKVVLLMLFEYWPASYMVFYPVMFYLDYLLLIIWVVVIWRRKFNKWEFTYNTSYLWKWLTTHIEILQLIVRNKWQLSTNF